ncbi:DUF1007 family protein [Citrobacter rodentium]|uniref:Exported protein n=2 Tax=Citrobacter rodentium TaxID=67825 RepID=D2TTZ1_CITRI|nr:DUF1007 family protein [Citrobacter rodentium]KIQ48577.1 membrane protein [Citrobacter rodentium]QBY28978.1 DUF1007 family protein [Citrobacter rodentium]UHO29163.1 DUF1007 family protein [Citrobacter rodentium NBRC 105723 = DSM 16636]CBG89223.1 putative exported protein [Citrobacter rodentium ICC168]HAT8011752.1 DUF1007 domain-containing protein [Citrobacter rodentium NBRC 105723 = DSM 16636]
MSLVKRSTLLLLLVSMTFTAGAHPHSFIRLKTEVISENDRLVALKMRWTMDELTSADLLYDAGDAKPGSEVWKKLAAEVMANVLGQHYFTEMWHNGQRVKFKNRPAEYGMAREALQAVLTFTLPLAEPQPLSGQTFTFSTFDPSYYVDMSYEEDRDAALSPAMKKQCDIALHTPTPSEESLSFARSLDKEDAPPEDMELGKQFAQKVTVTCR